MNLPTSDFAFRGSCTPVPYILFSEIEFSVATVLRNHGVEVHEAESLQAARFLWQPKMYDLILLDVRGHLPGEAREFYEQIRETSPRECFAYLVGPPVYLSRTWPNEFMTAESEPQQWGATVNRILTAA